MSSLYEFIERPDLESPLLVVALDGWIDAGLGAATATSTLLDQLDATTVAVFDADTLLDHRARRPMMHLVDGVNTSLTWPSIELRAAADQAGNDLLVLVGAEPDHTWQAFSRVVVDLALEFGVRMMIGLGAYPAATPHTRDTRLSITAGTAELAAELEQLRSNPDGSGTVQRRIQRYRIEI
ncbi:hypothetical protein BH20ACT2_BH20ACT2_24820 [soil metagenome]